MILTQDRKWIASVSSMQGKKKLKRTSHVFDNDDLFIRVDFNDEKLVSDWRGGLYNYRFSFAS